MKSKYHNLAVVSCPVCNCSNFKYIAVRFDSCRIVRCSDCGHLYLNPTLTDESLNMIYKGYHVTEYEDRYMDMVNEWFSDPDGPYQYILDHIEADIGFKGRNVLDVGCGPGRFLCECRKRGAIVTGVDSSRAASCLANKYFDIGIISKTVEEAVREGDLSSGKFDMIFAFEVMEHTRRPAEFLKILRKLLAPGGRLYVSTPNFYLFDLMGNAAPAMQKCAEHIQFFTPLSLENCLRLSGWRTIDIVTIGCLGYGDRVKQELVNIPTIRSVWHLIRRIAPIYKIKNSFFRLLEKKKDAKEIKPWSGITLMAVAKADEKEQYGQR